VITPSVSASYDSLQATLDRNLSSSALVKIAYTWSKAINLTDNSANTLLWNNPEVFFRNRALAGYNRTHNFRAAFVYDLPFGKGRRFANDNTVVSAFVGGWQLNGIFSTYSGTPFTVTASGTSLNAPGNTQTADLVKTDVQKLGGIGPLERYFDPAAFAPVTTARYGTSGRNFLRGPGTVNLDAVIARTFHLTERLQLQFRVEAYNVTNTPSFNNPSANASTPSSFMAITSARSRSGSIEGGERAFRFGVRLSF
jgi:hypothetical protein